jgi:hypothetical protein
MTILAISVKKNNYIFIYLYMIHEEITLNK